MLSCTPCRRVVGARYTTDKSYVEYFDPKYAALSDALAKALPQTPMITIIDSSADETKHLVYASSDIDPGHYYYFDTTAKRLSPIADERPQLGGVAMGTVKAVTYPAADGTLKQALNQAARQLLLLQSSDWAFIMKTGTMVDYAVKRTKNHINRFTYINIYVCIYITNIIY